MWGSGWDTQNKDKNWGNPCPSAGSSGATGAPGNVGPTGVRTPPPPAGCEGGILLGMRRGRARYKCPNGKTRWSLKGLQDSVPDSSDLEPFIWLGLAALTLMVVKGKKK